MENTNSCCHVSVCGTVEHRPEFSHSSKGKNFFTFPLAVDRLSGTTDIINIICPEDILNTTVYDDSSILKVQGSLRTFNNKSGIGNKLLVFVYANNLEFCRDEPENHVFMIGTICKTPVLRSTPLGRDICDLLVAVNRPYGHSDYIPCICWGQYAREAASFSIGDMIRLEGRIQSRTYIKCTSQGQISKTAYEVSASEISKLSLSYE